MGFGAELKPVSKIGRLLIRINSKLETNSNVKAQKLKLYDLENIRFNC
jgi:hypothetical protein